MNAVLNVIKKRHSERVEFDTRRPVTENQLMQILEAGRWAPTAHNMQNYEIIVVDDRATLAKLGRIRSRVSLEFLRENYEQLSSSKKELMEKKVGILGSGFPTAWRNPSKLAAIARKSAPPPLNQTTRP